MINNFQFNRLQVDSAIIAASESFAKKKNIDMNRMHKQIDTAKKVLYAYADGKQNVIIEAPTGFGKSILGMFLIECYNHLSEDAPIDELSDDNGLNNGYMLTSTKLLQTQYDRDVLNFEMSESLSSLRGQNNYICDKNGKTFGDRECSEYTLKDISPFEYPCVNSCKYILARKEAIRKSAVFNYAYWLTQMNVVYAALGQKSSFRPRKLTVMDECHLIGDILQNMFSSELNLNKLLRNAIGYYEMSKNMFSMSPKDDYLFNEANESIFNQHLISLCEGANNMMKHQDITEKEKLYDQIVIFANGLINIANVYDQICKAYLPKTKDEKGKKIPLPEPLKRLLACQHLLADAANSVHTTMKLYAETGFNTIVCTVDELKQEEGKIMPVESFEKASMLTIKLQCLDERHIYNERVQKFIQHGLLMSATIGDIDKFARQFGIRNYEAIYVESDFLFENSPIYKVVPMISMNYQNKSANMQSMINRVEEIAAKHKGQKGIVHTGNYEFANQLKYSGNRRYLTYNAATKEEVLMQHARSKDSILIGPSILEGVDLKDELARFCIFMKVPWPALQDKFNKEKMKVNAEWYGWATALNVQQGLGRPIRHKYDWAVSYFLDAGFERFLRENKMPHYIEARITSTPASSIGQPLPNYDKAFENFNLDI